MIVYSPWFTGKKQNGWFLKLKEWIRLRITQIGYCRIMNIIQNWRSIHMQVYLINWSLEFLVFSQPILLQLYFFHTTFLSGSLWFTKWHYPLSMCLDCLDRIMLWRIYLIKSEILHAPTLYLQSSSSFRNAVMIQPCSSETAASFNNIRLAGSKGS